MNCLLSIVFVLIGFTGRCDFANYFEIKLNKVSVYNSTSSPEQILNMEFDSLLETDLIEIAYHECGMTTKNDYELHIKVENTSIDLEFINDAPSFILNMGWLTQFKNRKATMYLHHTRYSGSSSSKSVHKIVDLFIV